MDGVTGPDRRCSLKTTSRPLQLVKRNKYNERAQDAKYASHCGLSEPIVQAKLPSHPTGASGHTLN